MKKKKNRFTGVCGTDVQWHFVCTFFPLLQGLCSAELGGILQEEPGGSESSSLAMHGEELVCVDEASSITIGGLILAARSQTHISNSWGHSSGMEIEMSLMVNKLFKPHGRIEILLQNESTD